LSVDIEEDVSVRTPPLEPVILNMKAGGAEMGLLEDESAPEDSIFSSGPPSSDDNSNLEKIEIPKRKIRSKTRSTSRDSSRADPPKLQESKPTDAEVNLEF